MGMEYAFDCLECSFPGELEAQCPCWWRGKNWYKEETEASVNYNYNLEEATTNDNQLITQMENGGLQQPPATENVSLKDSSSDTDKITSDKYKEKTMEQSNENTSWIAICKLCAGKFSLFTDKLNCSCGVKLQ